MNASMSKSVFAVLVAVSVLLGGQLTWAGSLPVWGGTTTTNQPQPIQQPIASQPAANTAQTVQPSQPTQPGLRTSPVTTRPLAVSTPVQQRVSRPQTGGAETPMSVAQDECVLFTKIWNPDPYSDSSAATPGRGVAAESVANFFGSGGDSMGTAPSDEETAAELDNFYFIKGYVVLEKGDYQVMYLQDLNFLRNINNNNSVEIIVRLPGINKISPGPDDWTKGKKSRITLRPGEMAEFDDGSGATLIKVRCP